MASVDEYRRALRGRVLDVRGDTVAVGLGDQRAHVVCRVGPVADLDVGDAPLDRLDQRVRHVGERRPLSRWPCIARRRIRRPLRRRRLRSFRCRRPGVGPCGSLPRRAPGSAYLSRSPCRRRSERPASTQRRRPLEQIGQSEQTWLQTTEQWTRDEQHVPSITGTGPRHRAVVEPHDPDHDEAHDVGSQRGPPVPELMSLR
jgi:hypothetical protein